MASSNFLDVHHVGGPLARARSYLFVPAHRPERIEKAFAAQADAVIVDLEDAVAPEAKDAARELLARNLVATRPVIIRINASSTPWFEYDLALTELPGVAAIMLPKAEDIHALREIGTRAQDSIPLIPLIETARGLQEVVSLAQTRGVLRLAFGSLDLQLDLGMQEAADEELAPYRAQLVLASRVAGIPAPIDGPTVRFDDLSITSVAARRARRTGFGGKLCIHPKQIDVVNQAFLPSDIEIAWAERIVAAANATAGAVTVLDGTMVDRPVLSRAESILAEAARRKA